MRVRARTCVCVRSRARVTKRPQSSELQFEPHHDSAHERVVKFCVRYGTRSIDVEGVELLNDCWLDLGDDRHQLRRGTLSEGMRYSEEEVDEWMNGSPSKWGTDGGACKIH